VGPSQPGGAGTQADAARPASGPPDAGRAVDSVTLAQEPPVAPGGLRFPFPQNKRSKLCAYPAGADVAALQAPLNKWRALVTNTGTAPSGGLRVMRIENANDTVSEGIAYGMLLGVATGDRAMFDGLWTYAKGHANDKGLMHWRINADGTIWERGSASDADEDMAFALLMAHRQWGEQRYLDEAKKLIDIMWLFEVDQTRGFALKAGDSWGKADVTFPSYFAPAYYRTFAKVTGQMGWLKVVDASYQLLEASGGPRGLAPEKITFTGATVEAGYKYNSCRIPWRIAMDYCWFGEPRAKAYLEKVSAFFSQVGAANIGDGYDINGNPLSANRKALAFTGPAVVGAIVGATFQPLLDGGWRRILELVADGTAFNYYQFSVGLLSMLMLTGNFNDFTL
jgi:endo-1,4-beta-D-glucanase Y